MIGYGDLRATWEEETKRLEKAVHHGSPPWWSVSAVSSPLEALWRRQANRALADGMTIRAAAETLAAYALARDYGHAVVLNALRSHVRRGPMATTDAKPRPVGASMRLRRVTSTPTIETIGGTP